MNIISSVIMNDDGIEVVRFSKLHGSDKLYVTLKFTSRLLEEPLEVIIPVSDLRKSILFQYVPDAIAVQNIHAMQQTDYIRQKIHDAQSHAQRVSMLLPQGFSCVDGIWRYVLGDTVINQGSFECYAYNPQSLKLPIKIDNEKSHGMSWFQWCELYWKQGSEQKVLFLSQLTPYIRPITESLPFPEKVTNSFVIGPSGLGKTAYCRLLTDIGNGKIQGVNLSSDKANIIAEFSKYKDKTLLLDDLNSTGRDETRSVEKKRTRLAEILQMSSSGGQIILKGESISLEHIGLLITGEEFLGAHSAINRGVVVRFETAFNSEALTILQKNRSFYDLFLIRFISWICVNADRLRKDVEYRLQKGVFDYLEAHNDPSRYIGFSRIVSSYKLLRITQYLLICFLSETHQFENIRKLEALNAKFKEATVKAINNTLEGVASLVGITPILSVILEVFRSDPDEVVADTRWEYKDLPNKVFFRFENFYFFKGSQLANYVGSKLDQEISQKAISRELKTVNLLTTYGGSLSSKLPLSIRGTDNGRYYRLSVAELAEWIQQFYPCFLERVNSPIRELKPKGYL